MIAKIQPLPTHWQPGTSHQVTAQISGASAGQTVTVDFFLTLPAPDKSLGQRVANVDNAGNALAVTTVTLATLGVNVIHIEATQGADIDSDSSGTIVL